MLDGPAGRRVPTVRTLVPLFGLSEELRDRPAAPGGCPASPGGSAVPLSAPSDRGSWPGAVHRRQLRGTSAAVPVGAHGDGRRRDRSRWPVRCRCDRLLAPRVFPALGRVGQEQGDRPAIAAEVPPARRRDRGATWPSAVPPVAGWRDTVAACDAGGLPRSPGWLSSCDRSTPAGLRDFAILTLLARLGLRSCEVAGLELDDIDWRGGELRVRGKGHGAGIACRCSARWARPSAAISRDGRPRAESRKVFLTGLAPLRAHAAGCHRSCRAPGLRANRTPRWGRTGCVTRWPPRCSDRERRCPTSARSYATGTWPRPLTPRWTWGRLRSVARTLAGSGSDERAVGPRERLPAAAPRIWATTSTRRTVSCRDFVAYLDAIGAATVTVEAALAWAQRPDAGPASSVWARRMTVVRGFARHMAGIDPGTEIPPIGLVKFRQRWRPPFIYSAADIAALMSAARRDDPHPAAGHDGRDADRAARCHWHAHRGGRRFRTR